LSGARDAGQGKGRTAALRRNSLKAVREITYGCSVLRRSAGWSSDIFGAGEVGNVLRGSVAGVGRGEFYPPVP
jgi:hypothetical protein